MKIRTLLSILCLSVLVSACTTPKETSTEFVEDQKITANVSAALAKNSTLRGHEIYVATFKREVELTGSVNNYKQAATAGDIALNVKGVKAVQNALVVNETKVYKEAPRGESTKEYLADTSVTAKVKLALAKEFQPLAIKVTTFKGVVTLSGVVNTHDDAARAEALAKTVEGVEAVRNALQVQ